VEPGGHQIDHNLYWDATGGAEVGMWNAGSVLDFSGWRDACDGCDQASRNEDPRFVDPATGDFRLEPDSPARGAGEGGVDLGAVVDEVGPSPDGGEPDEGTPGGTLADAAPDPGARRDAPVGPAGTLPDDVEGSGCRVADTGRGQGSPAALVLLGALLFVWARRRTR
jgi:MYXO-CTERM domain-containing protein